MLEGLLTDGRRVLLFSQFTEMLGLIGIALRERGIGYELLTGDTPSSKRAERIRRFQKGGAPLFLISLKAGGVGLNLAAADTVIHYDPWWNPAVEQQATSRAHRIGQHNAVFVYRLVTVGKVEEKIERMQHRKGELEQAVLEGGGSSAHLSCDEEDPDVLFAPV